MKNGSGAIVGVGVVVAALGYLGNGHLSRDGGEAPPMAPAASVADVGRSEDAGVGEDPGQVRAGASRVGSTAGTTSSAGRSPAASKDCTPVTVYYGTDRAVDVDEGPGGFHSVWIICGSSVLGFAALAGWLVLRDRRRWALATGTVGIVFAAGLFTVERLQPREVRGIHRSAEGDVRYGRQRGTLQFGSCVVSIPREHAVGQLERPSLLRLELQARSDRHVMLQNVLPCAEAEFYEAVRRRVASSPQRDLFVFVHGYNVTFELAARRTAQIAYDLHFQGAPLFYSWPSQGEPWNYAIDENNVAWTVPHLKQFLENLASHSDAQAINLIAHSMGNRALTQAVRELAADLRVTGKMFQQVILAAPDIDADVFQRDIAPVLTQVSSQVTLYASAHDDALAASRMVHGYRRAGDMNGGALVVPGISTVDVSTVDMSLLGHSYYGSSELILKDLAAVILQARPASQRPWLSPVSTGTAQYWRYEPPAGTTATRAPDHQLTPR